MAPPVTRPVAKRPRHAPLYPALVAALALGGVATTGCGPDGAVGRNQQQITTAADAGQPRPPDFIGGDVAYEVLPDGGAVVP